MDGGYLYFIILCKLDMNEGMRDDGVRRCKKINVKEEEEENYVGYSKRKEKQWRKWWVPMYYIYYLVYNYLLYK